ncbi:hypothetical protein SAMN05444365_10712 [Micromonospora pattaloongensis]|uniref:ATP-binding cassette, subfamily B n=1 Tax=Micromonospora pattaloongensis TaxID=405436 RepID=A0A1H3R1L6_9ACTN|nr:hypothetical protein SAMN05444365_10712 [Micromonospora pattaloongensis]
MALDGRPYPTYSHAEIRRRLAYVEQETPLLPGTIRDNLLFTHPEGAVVTIAHRLSTVLDADTIVVIENGRVRARGTHADLMERDSLYRGLVEALRIAESSAAAPA